MKIHEKQFLVLDFIKRFIASHGYAPTIREISSGLGYKSQSTIQDHLKALKNNGLITMNKNQSRTIELLVENEYLNKNDNTILIPLLKSIDKEIATEFIEIPLFMIKNHENGNLFAFKYDKSIFIVDKDSRVVNIPSLTVENNNLFIEKIPLHKVYGNIVSEFKQY